MPDFYTYRKKKQKNKKTSKARFHAVKFKGKRNQGEL